MGDVMYLRIRELREDNDISQQKLAHMLSIGQSTYSDYERGRLNVPIPILIRLAKFYNTSVDYLLGITDEEKPYPRK